MTADESGVYVYPTEQTLYIRVKGRGSFQNSQSLRSFAADMRDRGCRQFILDLEQCTGLDSTFLGMLTGIGLAVRQEKTPGAVHVINATAHSRGLLKSLWLDRLFHVHESATELPGFARPVDNDLRQLPGSDLSAGPKALGREETRELMATAHADLIRADPRNEPKFAEVIKQLRQEGQPPGSP